MKEKKQKKRLDIGLLYNVIMLLLFIAKTVKSFSKTADEAGPLRPFILAALVVYVLMFAATIIINLNDKKKLKSETLLLLKCRLSILLRFLRQERSVM